MINRNISLFLLFFFFAYNGFSLNVKIALLSDYKSNTVDINIVSGTYSVICDNVKIFPADLKAGSAVTLTYFEEKIRMERGVELIGFFSEIEFIGTKYNNVFSLKNPRLAQERVYEDNLKISINASQLFLVNTISLEKYVAGVVQSEVFGSSKEVEFFKIQAIISRTYCLGNLTRHGHEGCNLCDGVHCQAYKGRCTQADILRGSYESFSDVVVDTTNKLISTAYHSNSGGMTESAGNVWQKDVPYLQSIVDTFSVGARNYLWEKAIPKKQWINYFVTNYGSQYAKMEYQEKILNLQQPQRMAKWIIGTDTLSAKDIRTAFKLRSAYFSVYPKGEDVVLKGKGYGHGVGLSQEGAIEMVNRGYSSTEIICFYYRHAKVVKYTDIIDF
ncbi:MAG: SpoIID/LytB domain-containing protein [Bacteroidales bacterium]|jgi:stage II sporulation protein D|nr:SpoIID/LytB domain-containing protein [Bacteroidales bacterium]